VKVTLGDYVKEGQVLAVISSSDMANFNNEFNSSQSELAIAKKNLDAAEDMYKSGLRSQVDLITAQKEYQKAQSQLSKINEVLKIYGNAKQEDGQTSSSYIIKSPISGFIVEKNINTGMELRPDDGTNLFTISDLKEVWAVANLYESDIAKVQPGYHAEVSTISYGDKVFPGKVDKVGNVLNPDTKVLNLKIRLENPEYLLKPGMFARIVLRYPENKQMLSVPASSVVFDDNKNYVVLFKDKCKVSLQQVGVYKTLDNRAYIMQGALKEKDVIVTRNGLYVFTALKKL
jgi:cobalt-zinc-cadmium efflux system membrane fusion protein